MFKTRMDLRVAAMPTAKGMQRAWTFVSGQYARNILYNANSYEKVLRKAKEVAQRRLTEGSDLLPLRPSTQAQPETMGRTHPQLFGLAQSMLFLEQNREGKGAWNITLGWGDRSGMNRRGFAYEGMADLFSTGIRTPFIQRTPGIFRFIGVDGNEVNTKQRRFPTIHEDAVPTGAFSGWGFPRRTLFPTVPRMQQMIEKGMVQQATRGAKVRVRKPKVDTKSSKVTVAEMARKMMALQDPHRIKNAVEAAAEHMEIREWEKLVKRLKLDM